MNNRKCFILIILYSLYSVGYASFIVIPFETSMSTSINFDLAALLREKDWFVVKSLYDQFVAHYQAYYQEVPRIPKIIHQIWLGSPLPEKCVILQKTWQEKHPEWQYILWTDEKIQAFGLANSALYNASRNLGEKSDIARYEILYRLGGLYVDTDFECLQPFDIFHHCFDFYTGVGYGKEVQVWNGLIGSIPYHPIIKQCIETMQDKPARDSYEVFHVTGTHFYTKCFFEQLPLCSGPIAPLPVTYFYPWPNYARHQNDGRRYIQKESYGIHHWHVSWLK